LFLKGEIFNRDFIRKLKKKVGSSLVVWAYDSAKRYNSIRRIGEDLDLIYTFEPSDIPTLSSKRLRAKFLPLAYDGSTYFPMEDRDMERHLCFVGKLKDYPKRRKDLEKVLRKFGKDHMMKVWGRQYNNRLQKQYYRSFYPSLYPHIENKNLEPEKINEIYNTSAISLNIHHGQSVNGLNPRTFEILGSGGFQIVDHKSSLTDLFEMDKEIVSYRNDRELLEKVEYYLTEESERKKIGIRGHSRANKDHRFENRMMVIVKDIEDMGRS
jgi:spore maturation protein CgeB